MAWRRWPGHATGSPSFGSGAPLTLSNIAGGPLIGLATSGSAQIAVTSGTISACVANSGSCTGSNIWVPGTGSVNPVSYNGTCLVTNTSASISVLNFSTTTGGISTGTLVWIQQDPSGNWVITALIAEIDIYLCITPHPYSSPPASAPGRWGGCCCRWRRRIGRSRSGESGAVLLRVPA